MNMMSREEMDKRKVKFELSYSDFAMYDALLKLGIATYSGDVMNQKLIIAAVDHMNKAKLGPFVKNVVNELRMRFDEVTAEVFKQDEKPQEPFFGLGISPSKFQS